MQNTRWKIREIYFNYCSATKKRSYKWRIFWQFRQFVKVNYWPRRYVYEGVKRREKLRNYNPLRRTINRYFPNNWSKHCSRMFLILRVISHVCAFLTARTKEISLHRRITDGLTIARLKSFSQMKILERVLLRKNETFRDEDLRDIREQLLGNSHS